MLESKCFSHINIFLKHLYFGLTLSQGGSSGLFKCGKGTTYEVPPLKSTSLSLSLSWKEAIRRTKSRWKMRCPSSKYLPYIWLTKSRWKMRCELWRLGLMDHLIQLRSKLDSEESEFKRVVAMLSSLCTSWSWRFSCDPYCSVDTLCYQGF